MFTTIELIIIVVVNLLNVLGVVYRYRNRIRELAKKSLWKKLADQHGGLTFHGLTTDPSFKKYLPDISKINQSYVSGTYRGYNLKLETDNRSQGRSRQIYTCIHIFQSANQPYAQQTLQRSAARFTKADIINYLLPNGLSHIWQYPDSTITINSHARTLTYEEPGVQADIDILQSMFDSLIDLAYGYPKVLALGSYSIPGLMALYVDDNDALQSMGRTLLIEMAAQSRYRIFGKLDSLLCPNCLTRVDGLTLKPSLQETITYYGCRSCGQTNHFLRGKTVALLDQTAPAGPVEKNGLIQINWLARRALFDFDAVEIRKATDEEVERFVMQIGNDTDPWRRPRYAGMACTVAAACRLSENTLRLLRKQFAVVNHGADR